MYGEPKRNGFDGERKGSPAEGHSGEERESVLPEHTGACSHRTDLHDRGLCKRDPCSVGIAVTATAKMKRPETLSQARTWQRQRDRYGAEGLCGMCAAQAAYGHQLGFTHIEPPCSACSPMVARFSTAKPNGWRAL